MFKRVRLRFGLATLLFAISMLCIALGYQTNQAKRQQEALQVLCRGDFALPIYDYEIGPDGYSADAKPGVPQWMLSIFGKDFFYDVVRVLAVRESEHVLSGAPLDQAIFDRLGDLRELKLLLVDLDGAKLTDRALNSIAKATSLEHLAFRDIDFVDSSDLSVLTKLHSLRSLYLQSNRNLRFGDLCALRRLPLEELRISGTFEIGAEIAGFEHLKSLQLWDVTMSHQDFVEVSKLKHLNELDFGYDMESPLSAADARQLSNLPSLRVLKLGTYECTAEVLAVLNNWASLETVHFDSNLGYFAQERTLRQQQILKALPDKIVVFH